MTDHLVVVKEWSGKYAINEAYRPIAEALVKKFPELKYVPVKAILFVDNTETKAKHKDKLKYAQIMKVPDKWVQVIYQLTGRAFTYVVEVFKQNTEEMAREQIIALIYHKLRHIGPGGELKAFEIEEWVTTYHKLGSNWATTKALIPDLLEDGVDWDSIVGPTQAQLSLFEPGLRVVK